MRAVDDRPCGLAHDTLSPKIKPHAVAQIGLFVLSGTIFGFIWMAYLFKSVKEFVSGFKSRLAWVLCAVIPFVSIYYTLKLQGELKAAAENLRAKPFGNKVVLIIFGILFPLLPLNVVSLAILQKNINNLYRAQNAA